MRVHKALGVPELVIPAPFAMKPSFQDKEFVAYTSGGSYQMRVASGLMIGVAIFALLVAVIVSIQSGVWTPAQGRLRNGGSMPVWVLYPLGGFLLIAGLKYLHEAKQRSQIVINRTSGAAQIQYHDGSPTSSQDTLIHLTEAQLLAGPVAGRRTRWNIRKAGKFFVVAFGVAHDCFVIGAFRNEETAIAFASAASDESGVEFSDKIFPGLRHIAGEQMYLFRSSDRSALKRVRKTKPMQPIRFV
tara:strand:- start:181172 stop:181903 length:732 start_codon:yes stop_codon:yes gene_type:complete